MTSIRYRFIDEIKETLRNAKSGGRGCVLSIGADTPLSWTRGSDSPSGRHGPRTGREQDQRDDRPLNLRRLDEPRMNPYVEDCVRFTHTSAGHRSIRNPGNVCIVIGLRADSMGQRRTIDWVKAERSSTQQLSEIGPRTLPRPDVPHLTADDTRPSGVDLNISGSEFSYQPTSTPTPGSRNHFT
jgi:hypothetical protein